MAEVPAGFRLVGYTGDEDSTDPQQPQQPAAPEGMRLVGYEGQDGGDLAMPPGQKKPESTREWMDELSRRPDIPDNILFSPFAAARGVERATERIGEGLEQRAYDIADFFNFDTSGRREQLSERRQRKEDEFKRTQENFPVSSFAGELVGGMGAGPTGAAGTAVRLGAELGTGALLGAAEYVPDEVGSVAGNIALGTAGAGAGRFAAPYIQAGMSKANSLAAGLIEKTKGHLPKNIFNASGGLTDTGKRALQETGITPQEFNARMQTPDLELDPEQLRRQQLGEEFDIPLSKGDISQRIDVQQPEKTLARTGTGELAYEAQMAETRKLEAVNEAADSFQQKYGKLYDDRIQRGSELQKEAMDIRRKEREAVRDMYTAAEDIAGPSTPLDNESLVDNAYQFMNDRTVDGDTVKAINRKMAEFGLIGDNPQRKGRFSTVVDDLGNNITFTGEVKDLNLHNAERFRQALNEINPSDPNGQALIGELKGNLDRQIDGVVQAMKDAGTSSDRMDAFIAARNAHKEWSRKFKGKDIIDQLTSLKKGVHDTPQIDPSMVMDKIYMGKQGLGNLRKVKKLLTDSSNEASIEAWRNIQGQSMSDLFAASTDHVSGNVSGRRINNFIKSKLGNGNMREGELKLKELLGADFSEFQRLREAIGLATIPVDGAVNTSNTAYVAMMSFIKNTAGNFPGMGAVQGLSDIARESRAAAKAVEGIRNPTPDQVKRAVSANAALYNAFTGMGMNRALQTTRKKGERETEQIRKDYQEQ